jgi:hypothetical protein
MQLHPGWYWAQKWAQGSRPQKKEFFPRRPTTLPFSLGFVAWDSGENASGIFVTSKIQQATEGWREASLE